MVSIKLLAEFPNELVNLIVNCQLSINFTFISSNISI